MKFLGLSIVSALLVLAGCTVVVDDRGPPPPPRDRDQACLAVYDPVCGDRRGERSTSGNACEAERDRARIIHPGECRRQPPAPTACTREYNPVCGERNGQTQTYGNACVAEAERARILYSGECRTSRPERPGRQPVACPMIYDPVCGRVGRRTQTFGNSCEANAAGAEIVNRGECRPRG